MASLETLTIEIDGNASKASEGISTLMVSLSALGQIVRGQISTLREFSTILQDIKRNAAGVGSGLGSILNPSAVASSISKSTGAIKSAYSRAKRDILYEFQADKDGNILDAFGQKIDKSTATIIGRYGEKMHFPEYKGEMQEIGKETEKTTKATKELAEATEEVGRATKKVKEAHTATKGLMSQIGRIAKTMMIRTAIKALMKVAKQGLQNYYQYAKSINDTFASATSQLQNSLATTGNQIGAAIGSLISSIAPALSVLISLINAVAEALTMLFSLFSGKSTWSKAKNNINSIGAAAGGAGKQIKELLADFDELNVIASESSGGGGGGGGGSFGFDYEEEPLPDWMIQWKPLIEAIVGGGILSYLLMRLWDKIKKFFTPDKGDDLWNNMFKDKKIDVKVNGLDDAINKAKELDSALQSCAETAKTIKVSGLATVVGEAGALAAELKAATAAAEALSKVLEKLSIGTGIIDILKKLIEQLLGNMTTKVKVDRKEFDEFKKEFDKWLKEIPKKKFQVVEDDEVDHRKPIDEWCLKKAKKTINVGFDKTDLHELKVQMSDIDYWVRSKHNKAIHVGFDNRELHEYKVIVSDINAWVNRPMTKNININFANWNSFASKANTLASWCSATWNKFINVVISNWDVFMKYANALTDWANQKLVKIVEIQIVETNTKPANNKDLTGISKFTSDRMVKTPTDLSPYVPLEQVEPSTLVQDLADMFLMVTFGITNGGREQGHGYATGGFPNSGDLFIANERSAELVGSFGNKPGVVNNDQIIEGISRGVSEGQEEQNSLLRQQNELLRRILDKDSSVRIGASAALGRVARQSLDMYGSMVGG